MTCPGAHSKVIQGSGEKLSPLTASKLGTSCWFQVMASSLTGFLAHATVKNLRIWKTSLLH